MPLVGRCAVCTELHLCAGCFTQPVHTEHQYEFRSKPMQRWRAVPFRTVGTVQQPPAADVHQLAARDITDADYELLLQLDGYGCLFAAAAALGISSVRTGPVIGRLPQEVWSR